MPAILMSATVIITQDYMLKLYIVLTGRHELSVVRQWYSIVFLAIVTVGNFASLVKQCRYGHSNMHLITLLFCLLLWVPNLLLVVTIRAKLKVFFNNTRILWQFTMQGVMIQMLLTFYFVACLLILFAYNFQDVDLGFWAVLLIGCCDFVTFLLCLSMALKEVAAINQVCPTGMTECYSRETLQVPLLRRSSVKTPDTCTNKSTGSDKTFRFGMRRSEPFDDIPLQQHDEDKTNSLTTINEDSFNIYLPPRTTEVPRSSRNLLDSYNFTEPRAASKC